MVKAGQGGELAIEVLPPGTYGISYTVDRLAEAELREARVSSSDDALMVSIPDTGVITIYNKYFARVL